MKHRRSVFITACIVFSVLALGAFSSPGMANEISVLSSSDLAGTTKEFTIKATIEWANESTQDFTTFYVWQSTFGYWPTAFNEEPTWDSGTWNGLGQAAYNRSVSFTWFNGSQQHVNVTDVQRFTFANGTNVTSWTDRSVMNSTGYLFDPDTLEPICQGAYFIPAVNQGQNMTMRTLDGFFPVNVTITVKNATTIIGAGPLGAWNNVSFQQFYEWNPLGIIQSFHVEQFNMTATGPAGLQASGFASGEGLVGTRSFRSSRTWTYDLSSRTYEPPPPAINASPTIAILAFVASATAIIAARTRQKRDDE